MKRTILLFIALVIFGTLSAQYTPAPNGNLLFTDTICLWPLDGMLNLRNPDSTCWVVGTPSKGDFTAGHSGNIALVTDSVQAYGMGLDDSFTLNLQWMENGVGEGILSFYHKYKTDQFNDGGVIEYFNEVDKRWNDIREDSGHLATAFYGLPEDTVRGGLFGYSGNQPEWQYVELHWIWVMAVKKMKEDSYVEKLRFRFISDSTDTGKEGWMISDLVYRGYSIIGSAKEWKSRPVQVFPNPTGGIVYVQTQGINPASCTFELMDAKGQSVYIGPALNGRVDLTSQHTGIYFYRVSANGKVISSGKLLKE
jgi:hypothetical protein